MASGVEVSGYTVDRQEEVLTDDALAFLAELHRHADATRKQLLERRKERRAEIARTGTLDFLPETQEIRDGDWQVAEAPADLRDRRVEMTGPTDRKMTINALNSGAKVWLADLEDSHSPTWELVVSGQVNLIDAQSGDGKLTYDSPEGKHYEVTADEQPTVVVRPRGWHLDEKHITVDGEKIAGGLVDFGLYFFHNARALVERGSGPYYYLPKMESHLEARLWNDVFIKAQDLLGIPQGSVRATVLIETITAAFEMDEILYELRDHASGLNAGRWDYLFSVIKNFRESPSLESPDRAQLTMTVPFMRAYTKLLVETCHRRGAHAIGGMAAFIPNRRDPEVTERALAKVREDKERESSDGFDGTWVAHPDLVPLATEIFDSVLGDAPNQKDRRPGADVAAADLARFGVEGGQVTDAGIRANIRVALAYLDSWLQGVGAAAIDNLMEDAATAEIARSQLWLWRTRGILPVERYGAIRDEELERLGGARSGRLKDAWDLLDHLVLDDDFADFLTLRAYAVLE